MRSTVISTIALAMLASAPFLVPTSAAAAGPMCQGKEATIVDTDGGLVQGTDSNDVIHAMGRDTSVVAKAGDDLVCVEDGYVRAGQGNDSVQARGTDQFDYVGVFDGEAVDIDLAGGPDNVGLYFPEGGSGGGRVDGGPGENQGLDLVGSSSINVDLEDDRLALDSESANYTVIGFDNVMASAPRVMITGNRRENILQPTRVSCEILVRSGRGHDYVKVFGNYHELPGFDCAADPRPRLYGQRGNDTLLGRGFDDVLIGGQGRDVAKGSSGSDKCRAEREKRCER